MEKIMITEDEVPDILEKELPEMNLELESTPGGINIYKALQAFACYTKRCAELGNINKLNFCFTIADKLIIKGNNEVISAMKNVYIFSVSSLIELASPIQKQIQSMFPENLKNAYRRQIIECFP
jgi:hypothetical protein